MLDISISNVMYALVDQEVCHSSADKEHCALYTNLDLRMSHIIDGYDYHQSRGLHLLYYCMPHSSYVSVFSGVTASCFANKTEVKEWKHECTHDSCWRDIQIFSQVYFDMADKINAGLVKDRHNKVAPKDMHQWSSFRDGLFSWVKVKITKDPSDSYRKMIELDLDSKAFPTHSSIAK